MNNISELLFRAFISVIAVFILAKILTPHFQNLMDYLINPKKKKDTDDFNGLVASTKRKLQYDIGVGSTTSNSTTNTSTSKTKNKTIEKYLKSDDSLVIKLFENLSWGTGKDFLTFKKELKNKYHIDIEIDQITSSFNKIINDNILLKLNTNRLASFQEIKNLIFNFTILEGVISDIGHGRGKTLNGISRNNINRDYLIKSILILFLTNLKIKPILAYEHLLNEKLAFSNPFMGINTKDIMSNSMLLLFTKDHKKIVSTSELITIFCLKVDIFAALTYIPDPLKVEKKELYRLFNATPETDLKIIKSRYKAIALTIHPDRLSALDIPDKIKVKANENFANLQAAYKRITGE